MSKVTKEEAINEISNLLLEKFPVTDFTIVERDIYTMFLIHDKVMFLSDIFQDFYLLHPT